MSARWLLGIAVVAAACGKDRPARPVEAEVIAPRATFAGKDLTKPIGEAELAAIAAHRDVVTTFPRMPLAIPARGWADHDGQRIDLVLDGHTDGIPPGAVADPALRDRFVEVDPATGTVPVIVSPDAIAGADVQIAEVLGRPLTFTIEVGGRQVPAQIVGTSPRAIPRGFTLPIGVVAAWNRDAGAEPVRYSAVIVTLRDVDALDGFVTWLRDEHALDVRQALVPVPAPKPAP